MKGEQLKSWRQGKDLSRKQLGADFGVSEHTVAKWEQNVNPIPKAVERLVLEPPKMKFTIEEFQKLQAKVDKTGKSMEVLCMEFIKNGLKVLVIGLIGAACGGAGSRSGTVSGSLQVPPALLSMLRGLMTMD